MKKGITKAIIGVLMVGSLFSVKANAETYNINYTYHIPEVGSTKSPQQVYANSSQWKQVNGKWMLATSDFKQTYNNTWANVNGEWYFLDDDGYMVHDTLGVSKTFEYYYFTSSGAMVHDAYVYEPGNGNSYYVNGGGVIQWY